MGIECYCESRMYKTNANSRPLERHLILTCNWWVGGQVGWGAGVRAISDLVDPPRVQVAVEGAHYSRACLLLWTVSRVQVAVKVMT